MKRVITHCSRTAKRRFYCHPSCTCSAGQRPPRTESLRRAGRRVQALELRRAIAVREPLNEREDGRHVALHAAGERKECPG